MATKKIIIAGAGVVGLSTAYFLNKKGYEVTVVDETDGTQNCSVGNAGFLCPSHVIPLAAPGMITQGLKWMLNEKSPFYVKPRLSGELISWGLQFKKAATSQRVAAAAPVLNELTHRSQKLAEKILETEGIEAGYGKTGLLMACKTEKELHHEITGSDLAKSFGQQVEILSADETRALNPGLEMNIVGSVYYPNDSMLSPHIFVRKLREKLEILGVTFLLNTRIESFNTKDGAITGINSSQGLLTADDYVVAAGSKTTALLKPLGLNLPMQGGKGYSFMMKDIPVQPRVPAIFADGKVSMSPMLDGVRFSGTMEINGSNPAINPKRIEGIIDTITSFLPQFNREHFRDIQPWAGFRPCSPDGLPYVGKTHKYQNLVVSTGHAMLGVTLGPVSGEIVCNLLTDETDPSDLTLLNPDRYA